MAVICRKATTERTDSGDHRHPCAVVSAFPPVECRCDPTWYLAVEVPGEDFPDNLRIHDDLSAWAYP